MVFCLAAFANAQGNWSHTSSPAKYGFSGRAYKSDRSFRSGKSGDRKNFRDFKKCRKGGPGFYKNKNFGR